MFTDGSRKTGKSAITWHDGTQWQSIVPTVSDSPQIVELGTVVTAFNQFRSTPFNLVSDSAYVVNIVIRIEPVLLKEVNNFVLFFQLKQLWTVIS